MTPLELNWCILFWTRGDPVADIGDAQFNSSAGKACQMWMIDERLIVWSPEEKRYLPQERLGVFIEHLCAQPLPVQKWLMPKDPAQ
jgi:hypothetical protein